MKNTLKTIENYNRLQEILELMEKVMEPIEKVMEPYRKLNKLQTPAQLPEQEINLEDISSAVSSLVSGEFDELREKITELKKELDDWKAKTPDYNP